MQARREVRMAYWLYERLAGTWAAAVLVSLYGLGYFLRIAPPATPGARVLAVAKHANAKRQIDRVASWMSPNECDRIRTGLRVGVGGLGTLLMPASWRHLHRTLRILRVIERRHGFLVACRAAAAVAWYARTRVILAGVRPGAVLVSSDSNPEEVGFVAAARSLGIPRVFVSHAYPTPFSPPLDFSLSILEGEAAVRARMKKGPIAGKIVLAGVEGDSVPLDPTRIGRSRPVIGIFAPKALSWPAMAAIINDCRQHFGARQIVIRWHPSRLDPAKFVQGLGDLSDVEESSPMAALPDVARRCDWVIADENSNVHLPVLKLGIPTVAVKRLGLYPESRSDMYGFAAAGIVFPPVTSIRDVQTAAFTAFFADGWAERFRQYDASYLRPQGEVGAEVREAIWSLFEPAPAEATYA